MYTLNKHSSSDNLTNSFTIHEMYDCQCIIVKELNVISYPQWFVQISKNLSIDPAEGKEASPIVCKFKN